MDGKCGGGWLWELETLTHDGVWYGPVALPPPPTLYPSKKSQGVANCSDLIVSTLTIIVNDETTPFTGGGGNSSVPNAIMGNCF